MKESLQDQHLFIPPGVVFSVDFFSGICQFFFFKTYHSYQFQVIDHPNELLMMIYLDSHYSHFPY